MIYDQEYGVGDRVTIDKSEGIEGIVVAYMGNGMCRVLWDSGITENIHQVELHLLHPHPSRVSSTGVEYVTGIQPPERTLEQRVELLEAVVNKMQDRELQEALDEIVAEDMRDVRAALSGPRETVEVDRESLVALLDYTQADEERDYELNNEAGVRHIVHDIRRLRGQVTRP